MQKVKPIRIKNLNRPLVMNFVVKTSIIVIVVLSSLIIVEWIAGIPLLNEFFSAYYPMKPITATLLVLSSLSLWLFLSQSNWIKHVLRITGGIILFVSFLTFLTYLDGNVAHQKDNLLFNFFLQPDNRMAFITSLIFLFLGVIFILFANNSRTQDDMAHVLFFPAASLSYFSMISYVLGVSYLFRIEGITIAPLTAFNLFLLCIVLLFLKPDTWLMRILSGPGPGSIMSRRLLPWLLVLPVVIAWARIKGEQHDYFPSDVGVVLVAITYTITYLLLVWWSGLYVNRIDKKRRQAHDALIESEARLNALITATSDGVYCMSPDWKQMVSMKGGNFLNSVESPVNDWLNIFIPKDTQPLVLETIHKAIATKSKFELEHKVIRADGSIGWTLSRAIPVLDQSGEIVEWMGIAHDFTDRKQAEEALRKSEQRMKALMKATSNAIYRMSPDWGTLLLLSGEFFEEAENQPYKPEEYIPAEILPKVLETISNAIKNKSLFELEHQVHLPDGTVGWTLSRAIPILNQEGEIEEWFGFAEDITSRKQAEEALRESEEKYRRIIETANEGIILGNPDGKIIFVNRKMADMLGYSVDEIIGKAGLDFLTEDQKEKVLANRAKLKEKNQVQDEFCFQRKDGSLLWTISGTAPIVNGKGEHTGNIAMHTDISDRKRAEEVSAFQSRLLSEVNDAVFSSDLNFRITYWNQAAERMFGWTKEEALGKNSGELLKPKIDVSTIDEARLKLKNEGYWIGEVQYIRKDGTYFFVDVNSKILKDNNGKDIGQLIVSRDITERKRAEADLIAAKEKAVESDRLKSAFLANMSHELRTPLNSIIGFSELLTDPDFNQKQASQFAQIIHTNGNNLLSIINDIMDISKIEAGQVQVKNKLFSVNKLMTELHEEYSFNGIQKGIEIILDPMNPIEEVFIESDQTKMRQILVNLVSNAIKFTEKGFVKLGMRITGNFIEFHVKDTGIGIPADFQTQIFERFRQVESSDSRKYGGTGLGLTISKSLTELLGGTIWMESKKGEGSTFYFTVPIKY